MSELQWGDKGCEFRPDRCRHDADEGCEWCCMRCNTDQHRCPACGGVTGHKDEPCDEACAAILLEGKET